MEYGIDPGCGMRDAGSGLYLLVLTYQFRHHHPENPVGKIEEQKNLFSLFRHLATSLSKNSLSASGLTILGVR